MPETPKRNDPAKRLVVEGSEFWHEAPSPIDPIKLGIPLLSPSYRPPPGTIKEPDWLYEEGYLRKPKSWKPKDANAAAPSCPPPAAAVRTPPPARRPSPKVVVEIRATATKRRLEDEEVEPESNHSSADEDEEDEETMKWVPLPPPGVTLIKAYRSRVPKIIQLQPKKPKPKGKGKGKAKEDDVYQVDWIGALGKRGKGEYVVNIKWEGYGYDEMTWEPLENVTRELLDDYWNEHGSPAEQEAEMLPRPPKKTKKTYAGRRSVRK
ncbi:hypothetical protein ABEF92_008641 [Exophiala dermatitidis]|uniref:Chromo domain-containing protein n=1 Tax=Exophiala dermatitidis (strain ATCC 34100 / CBS 525.76 / NIH/UT8656) TaxID=858893 RepID=H6C2V5_EXODN|nr:uncharacterized protein HMPREF1120_06831 [Exophiala dermatitidis NIH/UT8656]EHY58829.1 hypothetical protein HMPREF1120_06831 [Exophiala dermatitidis NIH/UT8656]KAJ4508603.1 hypothetical protein HRR75_006424 [Exophiala dermatitidis]KAJ4545419.1 hypothetical protein HRR78_006141 [Exophiala dermatitidis]KAJ4553327.1 hypothetical protein HRR79_009620 [Exophiala dermatitidis]